MSRCVCRRISCRRRWPDRSITVSLTPLDKPHVGQKGLESLICLTNSIPAISSSAVISFSRQKSCKCRTRLAITERILGLAFGPTALITESVNLGSYLLVADAASLPFAFIASSAVRSSLIPSDPAEGAAFSGTASLVRGARCEKRTSLMDAETREMVSA